MRVALVNMPFFTVYHPSIGLGLLKSALTRNEVSCDVLNLNIDCADWIGLSDYNAISHTFTSAYNAQIGEWLFSRSLFGAAAPDPERYIQEILIERCGRHLPRDFIRRLPHLRSRIEEFLLNHAVKIDWEKYDIVGFATSFQQTTGCLAMAKLLKTRHPDVITVMGGANCEGEMGLTLLRAFTFIDAVFSGEADHTFPHFVRTVSSGQDLGKVDGVFHRLGGAICEPRNPIKPVDDLDQLPYPNYDDYFDQLKRSSLWPEISGPHSPQVIVETSRGCWWGTKQHCTFCGLNGSSMAFRSKSAERALKEFKYLHQRYRCFLQVVDNILDLQYIKTLFPRLAEESLGIQLFYETKVNLSKEQLRVLQSSGVIALQPGIESLNTNVLQLMRKGCTSLQNVQFLKWCKELGIEAGWNFIWGFPNEDEADYESMCDLVDRIRHLAPPMAVNKLQLHRFSPYFSAREAMGITNIRPHPSYFHIFPLPGDVISGLAYYFTFDYIDGRNPRSYAGGVIRKLREWQQAEGKSYLMYVDDGDTLTILRGVRRQAPARTSFRSAERQLYLFCGQVRSLGDIFEFAQKHTNMILEDVQHWLRNLVHEGLILQDNEHYLSLAVDVTQKCNSNKAATYETAFIPEAVMTNESLIPALPLPSDKEHTSATF